MLPTKPDSITNTAGCHHMGLKNTQVHQEFVIRQRWKAKAREWGERKTERERKERDTIKKKHPKGCETRLAEIHRAGE